MRRRSSGRTVLADDRARIRTALRHWADSGDFHGLRTRAVIFLVWGSALRLSEALALEVGQVLERPPRSPKRIGRVRGVAYIRAEQTKKEAGEGSFVITKAAREALRAYILEALRRGWMPLEDPSAPLFVTAKGGGHGRVGKRAVQDSWNLVQERARIERPYRFHDLRHDAITAFASRAGGDPFKVAAFGRLRDIRTASVYVHNDPIALARLAELADV